MLLGFLSAVTGIAICLFCIWLPSHLYGIIRPEWNSSHRFPIWLYVVSISLLMTGYTFWIEIIDPALGNHFESSKTIDTEPEEDYYDLNYP